MVLPMIPGLTEQKIPSTLEASVHAEARWAWSTGSQGFLPQVYRGKRFGVILSPRKLRLADLPVFIKVPPPEFRHRMSSLGSFTSLMPRSGSIQPQDRWRAVRGAVYGKGVDISMTGAGGLVAARRER